MPSFVTNKDNNIREWYMRTYPDDELGKILDPKAVFFGTEYTLGLFDILDARRDVYEYIGACDSVIRERVFTKLAEIMDVDYSYIYTQWLLSV